MALRLFEGFGVEMEYMIVRADSLDVFPATDKVLLAVAGDYLAEIERGELAWSNELVNHVIELKTNGPAPRLAGLDDAFARDVTAIQDILKPMEARLMPSAAHPWMDPEKERQLWPHEYNAVYAAYDRIFDTRGHGWANLQCTHVNLPFRGDDEFGRLHAAIRLILPLIPALAASSPILDARLTGLMDARMHYYRNNQKTIPAITGRVIPEAVYTKRDYQEKILEPMYAAIAPHDPDETLQDEWLNARGAIARFQRDAIEIRIIDIQECPTADLAVVHAIVSVLRALVAEKWQTFARQQTVAVSRLDAILAATTHDAEGAVITDEAYLASFGLHSHSATAGEVWDHLAGAVIANAPEFCDAWQSALQIVLREGPLARRIVRAVAGERPDVVARLGVPRESLYRVYESLCECLQHNRMFHAAP
jgi:gamma-glutamyl:cysteine ligase YbdK (ATP-grasp superfamily)